jgi:AraC-like DNA-binding protein
LPAEVGLMDKHESLYIDPNWLGMPLFPSGCITHFRSTKALRKHSHHGFEITYVSSGETTWEVEGRTRLCLNGGDVAITAPGVLHHGEFDRIAPCWLLWFWVAPNEPFATKYTPFDESVLKKIDDVLVGVGNIVARSDSLDKTFQELHGIFQRHADGEMPPFLVAQARSLMIRFFLGALDAFSEHDGLHESAIVKKARCFIENNLGKPISVADVAEFVGLSSSRFYECFKKETGQTPGDYLMRFRCAEARKMLMDREKSITDIAYNLGFSSSQYFADRFKKYMGTSPTMFRKRVFEPNEREDSKNQSAKVHWIS